MSPQLRQKLLLHYSDDLAVFAERKLLTNALYVILRVHHFQLKSSPDYIEDSGLPEYIPGGMSPNHKGHMIKYLTQMMKKEFV
jgi:hypothetical protein